MQTDLSIRWRWWAIGVAFLVPCLLIFGIYPLKLQERKLRGHLERSKAEAERLSAQISNLKLTQPGAESELAKEAWAEELRASLPAPYMVVAPDQIKALLTAPGTQTTTVQLRQLLPLHAAPGYARAGWDVEFTTASALEFGESLARLENRFPLGYVEGIALRKDRATGRLVGALAVEILVKP